MLAPLPLFWKRTSTPSILFCQSGSPAATSDEISLGTIVTMADPVLSLVSESGEACVEIAAVFIGALAMNAPTLMIHSTDAPAASDECVQVTSATTIEQSAASGPAKLAKLTSGGSWSWTVKLPLATGPIRVTVIL